MSLLGRLIHRIPDLPIGKGRRLGIEGYNINTDRHAHWVALSPVHDELGTRICGVALSGARRGVAVFVFAPPATRRRNS